MKLKRFTGKFLTTRPEIFIFLSMLFLLIGTIAIHDPFLRKINPNLSIKPLTIAVWVFGLTSFYLGMKYSKFLLKLREISVILVFVMGVFLIWYAIGFSLMVSLILNVAIFSGIYTFLKLNNRFLHLFIIGCVIFILNFVISGIPLLNPSLHHNMLTFQNPLFFFGFYSMLLSLTKLFPLNPRIGRILFLLVVILTAITTFRGFIGFVILTWIFHEAKTKDKRKSLTISAMFLLMLILIITLGYYLRISKGTWKLNPLRTIEYRFAFTLRIFNTIVEKSFPFGYAFGKASVAPGLYVCESIFNCTGRLTSTVFGQPILDLGIIGVFLMMFYFGGILKELWKRDYSLYAILMSHLIVFIEGGTNIFTLSLFTYLGYMRLLKWKSRKQD